jgi:hypothetical protein
LLNTTTPEIAVLPEHKAGKEIYIYIKALVGGGVLSQG